MNILMVTGLYPRQGEADPGVFALHRFCRRWVRRHSVIVLRPWIRTVRNAVETCPPAQWRVEGVPVLTVPVMKFPLRPWFSLRKVWAALETAALRPDVVTGHLGFSLDLAERIAGRLGRPLVAGVHMGDLVHGPRMLGEKRLAEILHRARLAAPRSPAVRRRLLTRYPDLRNRCRTAWSGLERPGYLPAAAAEARLRKLAAGEPLRLLTACHLLPLKRVDVTLRALAMWGQGRSWSFTVAGDGPERRRLERLAAALKLTSRVRFTGSLDRRSLRREMARAHLFVQVSAPETFGLVYLEAMGAGCLVVGARGEGVDGIVVHGRNGWLCRPGDERSLARLLESAAGMELTALLAMGEKSRRTVAHLTEEAAADNYLGILEAAAAVTEACP